MGILRRIGIEIGSFLLSCITGAFFTVLIIFLAILIIGQIIFFNEIITAAYNSGYGKGYQSGLEIGRKEGLPTDVDLRNPTYKELLDFLRRDKTDLKPWIEDEYDCTDFSAEVNNNAELEGIRAAFVSIDFPQPPGHAIVAFQTVDKGLIFIEPQSDGRVKLVIGERFHQLVKAPQLTVDFHWTRPFEALFGLLSFALYSLSEALPGFYYSPPPHDDTIVEYRIIW